MQLLRLKLLFPNLTCAKNYFYGSDVIFVYCNFGEKHL
jgi:hypothetical protein